MFIDADSFADTTTVESDVCIIGGGAAGNLFAFHLTSFVSPKAKICILEGGSRDFEPSSQGLYSGRVSGNVLPGAPYLSTSRLRYFGGTTNHWSGWCRPLDAPDFESRSWIPHSGWPISRAELDPYYAKADSYLGFQFDGDVKNCELRSDYLFLPDDGRVQTSFFTVSPFTNKLRQPHGGFQKKYARTWKKSRTADVILGANVQRLATDSNGATVRHAAVRTRGGKNLSFKAKHFILASGGIENARLLLLSNDVNPHGLGNEHDLVGRFFMEHPHVPMAARLLVFDSAAKVGFYNHHKLKNPARHIIGVLAPTERALRQEGVINFCAQLISGQVVGSVGSPLGRAVHALGASLVDAQVDRDLHSRNPYKVPLLLRTEQVPNPDSRVMLDPSSKDAFGQPTPLLNWQLCDSDRKGYERSLQLIGEELGARGIGRLQMLIPKIEPNGPTHGGAHHMGTTRMHSDPHKGVVDVNCRVHSVDNLFVAGSSVFTTGGVSNPTFTIGALAVRLADHVGSLLQKGA